MAEADTKQKTETKPEAKGDAKADAKGAADKGTAPAAGCEGA
jgi:hypothetical protein